MNSNDRSIVGLVTVAHALVHTYELSIPVLVPIWLVEFDVIDLGITQVAVNEASLGILVAVGYSLFGLGSLPGGILVDRLEARRLIVVCLLGMGTSFLLLAAVPSLLGIGFALMVWGIAASVYHPSGLSLISRGVQQRGSAFAYHGMAGNFGIAFGPLMTLLLLVVFDWRLVVGLLAVPAVLAAVAALRVEIDERAAVVADGDEEHSTSISSFGGLVVDVRTLFVSTFALVFVVAVCSGLYYRGVLTFLPELFREMPVLPAVELSGQTFESGDYIYAGLLMVGIAGQYTAGKLTDRYRPEFGLLGGFGALTVIALFFLPAVALGLPALLAAAAFLGFFLFAVQPFYQASVAKHTPPGKRGLAYGLTYLGVFGVGALGAVIAGTLLTYFAASQLFLALGMVAIAATVTGGYLSFRAPAPE